LLKKSKEIVCIPSEPWNTHAGVREGKVKIQTQIVALQFIRLWTLRSSLCPPERLKCLMLTLLTTFAFTYLSQLETTAYVRRDGSIINGTKCFTVFLKFHSFLVYTYLLDGTGRQHLVIQVGKGPDLILRALKYSTVESADPHAANRQLASPQTVLWR
jgi:hypothetical protein